MFIFTYLKGARVVVKLLIFKVLLFIREKRLKKGKGER